MPKRGQRRAGGLDNARRPHKYDGAAEAAAAGRICAHGDCVLPGEYRAPVSPVEEGRYTWFCLQHVREYNKAWNYCAGRSDEEIEALIRADIVGGRPTWPLGRLGGRFARNRFARFRDSLGLFEDEAAAEEAVRAAARERARRRKEAHDPAAELERAALDLMELNPPVTEAALKARYKALVKLHHPDANGGDKEAEERLKLINQAYATLKQCLCT